MALPTDCWGRMEEHTAESRSKTLAAVGLAALTVLLYHQVRAFDFVNFDDFEYVVQNPHVNTGLSFRNLLWALGSTYASNWHPLTWVSHMLDCELFGLSPGAHHLSNLLYHTLNTVLLFHVLHRMTGALWRSALVSALFAIHPLHVESVAWISERKDLLCTLFFLLTLLFYQRYTEKGGAPRYLLLLVSYTLGLMAKPMIVTLPFVLILLDFWPLQRCAHLKPKLLLEKLPLFLLAAASSTLTYLIHAGGGSISHLPLGLRLENALSSYALYLGKTFWPAALSCFYPHPQDGLAWEPLCAALLLLIATAGVLFLLRRLPYLFTGWLWFLGTIVPVSGVVQTGAQAWADRYTYIPLIGIFLMLAWGINDLLDRIRWSTRVRALLFAALAIPLLAVSHRQIGYWKDSVTLFHREIEVNGPNPYAYTHLGNSFDIMGDHDRALFYLSEALRVMPAHQEALYGMANTLTAKGRFPEAEKHYSALLGRNPDHYKALNNRAYVLIQLGRTDEAVSCLRRALRVNPDPMTKRNLEQLLQNMNGGPKRAPGTREE